MSLLPTSGTSTPSSRSRAVLLRLAGPMSFSVAMAVSRLMFVLVARRRAVAGFALPPRRTT